MKSKITFTIALLLSSLSFSNYWPQKEITPEFISTIEHMRVTIRDNESSCKGLLHIEIYGAPNEYQKLKLLHASFKTYENGKLTTQHYLNTNPVVEFCTSSQQLQNSTLEFLYTGGTEAQALIINDFTLFSNNAP